MSTSSTGSGLVLRPMRSDDVPAAERLTGLAYAGVDRALPSPAARASTRAGDGRRDPAAAEAWRRRTSHLVGTDPAGCWVAEHGGGGGGGERGGELVGVAVSSTRELMWLLASFAVTRDLQGRGVGRALLEAALAHGRGCLRGMLASSADPAAVRRYRLAGFDLHPQMVLTGVVDRDRLPTTGARGLRDGTAADVDLMDSVDRRTRGAAHGPDHAVLLATSVRLVVADRPTGQGYAYLGPSGAPTLLAATSRRVAEDLAWEALASAPPGSQVRVDHVTAANQWALDVGLAAGLAVHQRGYLGVRRCRPPTTYLHHGALL